MPTPALHASIRLIDEALRDRPVNSAVTIHTCSGNFQSTWMACGGHEPVAGARLDAPDLDGHLLEYDTERAGGFEPLRLLAKGKKIVLGLVTSKSLALGSAEALHRRIDEAARYVPRDNLCLSPQCGISSAHHGNALTETDQWAKLARVVEVAADLHRA